jgi:two-component system, chemotaxis family, protein-glutamate methylesterase/glutaminase
LRVVIGRERQGRHKPPSVHSRIQIVALASSTGGLRALQELVAALPAGFPVPILAVQHLAKDMPLVGALAANYRMRVKLAEHREPMASGTIYIALTTTAFGSGHLAAPW